MLVLRVRWRATDNWVVWKPGGCMASYIPIDKLSESEGEVHYRFYDTAFPDLAR